MGMYCDTCVAALRAALAHERDRARRVVRVFWRVRWDAAPAMCVNAGYFDLPDDTSRLGGEYVHLLTHREDQTTFQVWHHEFRPS